MHPVSLSQTADDYDKSPSARWPTVLARERSERWTELETQPEAETLLKLKFKKHNSFA